eukprot:gene13844-13965_t
MRELSSKLQQQIRVARPWDLAQAAWACSKLQFLDTQLLDAIAKQSSVKAAILLPQDIAQLASAYARLGFKPPKLLNLLQQQALLKAAEFQPWSLVHTAWALDTCGCDCRQLLEEAAKKLTVPVSNMSQLKALDLSTLLGLLAAYSMRDEPVLNAAAGVLVKDISSYPASALAQVVISLAGLGFCKDDLSAAAVQAVQQQLAVQQCTPRQVAFFVFGLAKMGVGVHSSEVAKQVYTAAAAAFVAAGPGSYAPELLSMLQWGMLLGGYYTTDEQLQQRLVQQAMAQLTLFTADQF